MLGQTTIIALLASLAAAQHAAVGNPSGNPITRPLNEVVPACKAFTITWQPTTPNTVSLVLLRGPSTNVVPLKNIVVGIANSGSFVWTPDNGLEADVTRYGIQLIDDITGQYQYSTQFGISKGPECQGTASSSAVSSGASSAAPSSTPSNSGGYPVPSSSAGGYPVSSVKANSTTVITKTSMAVLSTGAPAGNSTVIQPTKPLSVPSSLIASATGGSASATHSTTPQSTGAASSLQAGLSLVGAAAAFAFML
ncbi:Ser-Thr-rich glycosyl-phosphatidyl-inositol-anchored membrane family-domain-containing protein [Phaeosphaeriaceae sp. PMI808]|nr:Ser-Thr-rich glycosyl-phosphatidyl-inositol-anchored membrane family-domain-containing protein [Phaeosphaeriaceae sp. PMI808]